MTIEYCKNALSIKDIKMRSDAVGTKYTPYREFCSLMLNKLIK